MYTLAVRHLSCMPLEGHNVFKERCKASRFATMQLLAFGWALFQLAEAATAAYAGFRDSSNAAQALL
eukprot:1113436-Pelagomonas_calceolata.AAC.3